MIDTGQMLRLMREGLDNDSNRMDRRESVEIQRREMAGSSGVWRVLGMGVGIELIKRRKRKKMWLEKRLRRRKDLWGREREERGKASGGDSIAHILLVVIRCFCSSSLPLSFVPSSLFFRSQFSQDLSFSIPLFRCLLSVTSRPCLDGPG